VANLKSIKLGKSLHYELLLIFEWFKGKSVKDIHSKLPKGYAGLKTVYRYHQRYERAIRKARELTKGW
jgi:hypothetical protein